MKRITKSCLFKIKKGEEDEERKRKHASTTNKSHHNWSKNRYKSLDESRKQEEKQKETGEESIKLIVLFRFAYDSSPSEMIEMENDTESEAIA